MDESDANKRNSFLQAIALLNSGARDGLVFSGNNALYFLRVGSTTTFILRDRTRIPNIVSDNSNQLHTVYNISIQSVSISI